MALTPAGEAGQERPLLKTVETLNGNGCMTGQTIFCGQPMKGLQDKKKKGARGAMMIYLAPGTGGSVYDSQRVCLMGGARGRETTVKRNSALSLKLS